MKRLIVALVLGLVLILFPVVALATTTADVTVTSTPSYIGIAVSPTTYDFGVVVESATPYSTTSYFTITNTSSIATNQSIGVTGSTWTGGTVWTHSDTATAGADIVGLKSNKGGTWGTGDVIVKYASPNNIAAAQAANTNYSFGLKQYVPTSFSDGVQKSNTVRITAVAS